MCIHFTPIVPNTLLLKLGYVGKYEIKKSNFKLGIIYFFLSQR